MYQYLPQFEIYTKQIFGKLHVITTGRLLILDLETISEKNHPSNTAFHQLKNSNTQKCSLLQITFLDIQRHPRFSEPCSKCLLHQGGEQSMQLGMNKF